MHLIIRGEEERNIIIKLLISGNSFKLGLGLELGLGLGLVLGLGSQFI